MCTIAFCGYVVGALDSRLLVIHLVGSLGLDALCKGGEPRGGEVTRGGRGSRFLCDLFLRLLTSRGGLMVAFFSVSPKRPLSTNFSKRAAKKDWRSTTERARF